MGREGRGFRPRKASPVSSRYDTAAMQRWQVTDLPSSIRSVFCLQERLKDSIAVSPVPGAEEIAVITVMTTRSNVTPALYSTGVPRTGPRPRHLALTCQLLGQHVELIGVQATPHVRGELPAHHLQELAQRGRGRVVKENQVLK